MQANQPLNIEEVRQAVRLVCARRPIRRVDVFGSVARGDPRPDSDVDLLVEFTPEAQPGLFEMGALCEDLQAALGRHVDLVSRAAIERSHNPYRRRAILDSSINIYAR
jgi:predicted nucleotidyltransferase